MKWIGVTGGIASGKSSVSQILKKLGFNVADADQIARDVVALGTLGLQKVSSVFGDQILNPDQSLNRRALGQMVFGNPHKLLQLEQILHPLVQAETLKQKQAWQAAGEQIAFYDVPLLFEKKLEAGFDGIIVVTTSEQNQKNRMKVRDQLSDSEIVSRLSSQLGLDEKVQKATWVVHNDGTLKDLENRVQKVVSDIHKKFNLKGLK
jgi:dephospho-CoA kinase